MAPRAPPWWPPCLAVPKADSAPGSLQVPPAPTLSTVPAAGLTCGRGPLHTWLEAESGLLVRPSDSNSQCPSSTWRVGWHGRQAVCLGLPNPARKWGTLPPQSNSGLGGTGLCCPLVVRSERCTGGAQGPVLRGCPAPCSTTPQMQTASVLASSSQRSWRAPWLPRMSSSAVSATPTPPLSCPPASSPTQASWHNPHPPGDLQGTHMS